MSPTRQGKSFLTAATVIVVTLTLLVASAAAAPALDQSQTVANDLQPIPGAPAFPAYRVAQTFTAGITGTLDQIDILLVRQMNPGDLMVEIRSVASGVPTATILATATVSESSVPSGTSAWVPVPFNVPAPSTAGTQYAIVVYAPFGFCGGDCWHWWGGVGNPYGGGAALFALDGVTWVGNDASLDFAFKTYVTRNLPTSVSGQGVFGTGGDGRVTFALSNAQVSFDRIRGERFSFVGDVESVTGSGNEATLTGTGSWNGQSGYALEVSVVDKASWGRLEDTISVVIRDPAGAVVFTCFGPQVLKQGDISVTTADSG